jgi:type IV secretory pathway TraG/TraD family ATPase VirD4
VLTAKPDDRELWKGYCLAAGRNHDVLVFSPETALRFNFLNFELTRPGRGGGITENLVALFSAVLEVAERGTSGNAGRDDEGYWRRALRQLVRNAIDLLALATGSVSVPDLYRVVISAATSREQLRSTDWRESSFCMACLKQAETREKSESRARDFELVADYWLVEYPALSDKTRSVVVSTFTSMVDVLNRGILRELFCGETNVTPAMVEDGAIIIVDLPVKEFGEVGQFAQTLWKYCFQRSIERRDIERSPRPVFLFADEAHHIVTSYDQLFQTTCRSSRVATCYLTQNVSNLYAALGGGEKGRAEAASLLGNLNTKILHCNGDPVTNEWGSSLIGRTRQAFASGNASHSPDEQVSALFGLGTGGETSSSGFSEGYEFEVQPRAFTQLRTGGPENDWEVDGIVFQNGKTFRSSGTNWLPVTFRQR